MNKVIDITLEEYTKDIIEESKKENIKGITEETFRQQYYDTICENIQNDINISQRVYDSIPDLHYWIYKHYEMRGYRVVERDLEVQTGKFELVEIKAS